MLNINIYLACTSMNLSKCTKVFISWIRVQYVVKWKVAANRSPKISADEPFIECHLVNIKQIAI